MNVNHLIDSIVRQTTILIAQLATAAGGRPSLAHTANQVFVDLVRELKEQGVGNKVIADMFGLALRTYHDKVRRLEESSTHQGRSLWEAVLEYIREKGTVVQTDVMLRQTESGYGTTQGYAPAYPSLRQLQVLYDVGERAVPASICAKEVNDPNAPDYAYLPALNALIERLEPTLSQPE